MKTFEQQIATSVLVIGTGGSGLRAAIELAERGETFWEPGGDVIHYSDGNVRDDVKVRFLVTMLCAPGQPMLTLVEDDELIARRDRRVPAAKS